mmetsp:Transcript_14202/g.17010  ORF Transcript_14202/g.17010 Transcript_14202/m.17010 type:complete len:107 (+) Transcript_14202:3-323(+)
MAHTIVLMTNRKGKQMVNSWKQYANTKEAFDGICHNFEEKLKADHPGVKNLTYDISDLFNFIDDCPDIVCMVLDNETHTYIPRDKKWIKTNIFRHLKRQVEEEKNN